MNYEEDLKQKYQKSTLTIAQVAKELNISKRMVADRVRDSSSEIPNFKKVGAKALFPIKKVAYFLEHGFIEVM